MSPAHDREHARRLEAALAGDLAADDPALERILASCGTCRARLEELRAVRTLLDDAGREQRETLSAIDWDAAVPGGDQVAPFVRRKLAERGSRRRVAWRAALATAAAATVAAFWIVRHMLVPDEIAQREVMLSADSGGGLLPSGKVQEYRELSWPIPLPPGGRFELRVFDDRPGAARDPIVAEERLTEARWTPSTDLARSLPELIRWEVRVYDATGTLVRTESTRAQRESR
jgi:hypothetical protein